jgi:molecular chaperone GrpE
MSDEEQQAAGSDDGAVASEQLDGAPTGDAAAQAVSTPRDTAGTEAQARIAELERRVAELEQQHAKERDAATDYMQRWQRAQADFTNFKRRAQQEQELAEAQALAAVLPALDSFERAFASLPPTLRHFTWIDGIGLVHLQLHSALRAAGIHPISVEPGSAYDPRKLQASGEVETRDSPPGTVAVVVQQGYERGGVVLRPALVQLAREPSTSTGQAGASQAVSQEGQGPAP